MERLVTGTYEPLRGTMPEGIVAPKQLGEQLHENELSSWLQKTMRQAGFNLYCTKRSVEKVLCNLVLSATAT